MVPIVVPALIVGYVQYSTLTLIDRKTFFGFVMRNSTGPIRLHDYEIEMVEVIGQPIDT